MGKHHFFILFFYERGRRAGRAGVDGKMKKIQKNLHGNTAGNPFKDVKDKIRPNLTRYG